MKVAVMRGVAGVAGGAVLLGLVWMAVSGGQGSPTEPPSVAGNGDAEPAAEFGIPDPGEIDNEAGAGDGPESNAEIDAEIDNYTVPPATAELPDDAEIDAESAAGQAELGSATLTIDREWDWGLGGADGAPMWVMGDVLTLWTDYGSVAGMSTDSMATFEFFDGQTTTFASAPVSYVVEGAFRQVLCEFELTVTETWRLSEAEYENTYLGPIPGGGVDVVTTFTMTFGPGDLQHFEIAPGSHNGSFSLSDVVIEGAQGCTYTD